jgi:primosomal replication protein N
MNHVNLIGKLLKTLEPKQTTEEGIKKVGTCFILETKSLQLDGNGKPITKKYQHRVVLKGDIYLKFINRLRIGSDLAVEGYLAKGKVIATDIIIL